MKARPRGGIADRIGMRDAVIKMPTNSLFNRRIVANEQSDSRGGVQQSFRWTQKSRGASRHRSFNAQPLPGLLCA